jgi:hypothetical protein
VPVIVEGELPAPDTVRVELDLPPIAALPALWLRMKPSPRYIPMAPERRRALYYHTCPGIAIRLAYEACRALPSLKDIKVSGTRPGVDPAETVSRVLHLSVYRDVLLEADLDGENAHAILLDLGGDMGATRGDEFEPLLG